MLSKEICRTCILRTKSNGFFPVYWGNEQETDWWWYGTVFCVARTKLVSIQVELPPENCRYALEHISSLEESQNDFETKKETCVLCGGSVTHRKILESMSEWFFLQESARLRVLSCREPTKDKGSYQGQEK